MTVKQLEAVQNLTPTEIERLAYSLYEAERSRQALPPLTTDYPAMSIADAYAIQQLWLSRRLSEGRKLVGRKVGLTSKPMQQMLGVDQPDFGLLLDDMVVADGGGCLLSKLIQPKVEPEIAFVLARNLSGPGLTAQEVLDATEFIAPALEIVDSRIHNWQIKLADTIADNASSGRFVLGSAIAPARGQDLGLMGMVLEKNGQLVDSGAGAAALGHPANAVAWLGNKLAEFGESLKAGEVILPGALCRAIEVNAGDSVKAEFAGLGTVSVRFV